MPGENQYRRADPFDRFWSMRDAGGFALFMRVIAKAGGPDHLGTWFWPPRV